MAVSDYAVDAFSEQLEQQFFERDWRERIRYRDWRSRWTRWKCYRNSASNADSV